LPLSFSSLNYDEPGQLGKPVDLLIPSTMLLGLLALVRTFTGRMLKMKPHKIDLKGQMVSKRGKNLS
jgi:hypothetical protein